MSKRFTDIKKWRNEWFRTLPEKAKLAWIYLCDECDVAGIWKADYGLASFQLNFKVTKDHLTTWFGDKIHSFGSDQILIIAFFEFQYGESKDTWTAKVKARNKLESLGFIVKENKVLLPQSPHSTPTVAPQCGTVLSVGGGGGVGGGVGVGVGVIDITPKESHREKVLPILAELWNQHCGSLPKVIASNPERDRRSRERLLEATPEEWTATIQRVEQSKFCNGFGEKGWKATFDWLINPNTRAKIIEGKYDDRAHTQNPDSIDWLAEAEIFVKAIRKYGAGDQGVYEYLGPERSEWFRSIGRSRIAGMPDNDFARRDLAKLIKFEAQKSEQGVA